MTSETANTDGHPFRAHCYETPDWWFDIILEAHNQLLEIDPDYKIEQIKEKYWQLRYYYSSDFEWNTPERTRMEEIIDEAERKVAALEAALKADK